MSSAILAPSFTCACSHICEYASSNGEAATKTVVRLGQIQPLMTAVLAQTGQVPRAASLDAGYFSEANVEVIATLGCEPLMPLDR